MAGAVLNGTYTSTVYLNNGATQNPLSITNTGLLAPLSGDALQGAAGTVWTIANAGTVASTQPVVGGDGVHLLSGGIVTNQAGGTITAVYAAVDIAGATGTVINYNSISSTGNVGINLEAGGALTNAAGAVIDANSIPVVIGGTGGSVLNYGLIANSGVSQNGIQLAAGSVSNAATGTISAAQVAVDVIGAGSIGNDGTIIGTVGWGIILVSGGTVTNGVSAGITAALEGVDVKGTVGLVDNSGLITATSNSLSVYGSGIVMEAGGAVTNHAGGTISGYGQGIGFASGGAAADTVVNAGHIAAPHGDGVDLGNGGTLSNAVGGVITGFRHGIDASAAAVVTNQGSVSGATAIGLDLGGSVTNSASGVINGNVNGVLISQAIGTVVNQGHIAETGNSVDGFGVELNKGGYIGNAAGATITGYIGVMLRDVGTVINAGTIAAAQTGGIAIRFADFVASRLVDTPGAVFSGLVVGGYLPPGSPGSVLELASATAHGTITGIGSQFTQFQQFTVDAGAYWQVIGSNTVAADGTVTNQGTLKLFGASLVDLGALVNNGVINVDPSSLTVADLIGTGSVTIAAGSTLDAQGTVSSGQTIDFTGAGALLQLDDPGNFAGTISGFGPGATIGVPSGSTITSGTILPGNTLQLVTSGSGTIDLRLDPAQDFSGETLTFSGGSASFAATCFCPGTRILTERGEIAVEMLRIGDRVMTVRERDLVPQPVKWLGRRMIDCRRHPRPEQVWPVLVRAGAFAKDAPSRDLWLSPDHAVFVNDVLIPVKYLINGSSIVQVVTDSVTYHHVELAEHDVLLAENLPCETYLDTGDRANFDNGGRLIRLHPDFAVRVWEAKACAPLHVVGPQVEHTRFRLQRRVAVLARQAGQGGVKRRISRVSAATG